MYNVNASSWKDNVTFPHKNNVDYSSTNSPAVIAIQKKEIAFQTGCANAQERRLTVRTLVNGCIRFSKKERKAYLGQSL